MWSREIDCRMRYIRANQDAIRRQDAELMGLDDVDPNENIYLPASFLGSSRWCSEQIADALAIAAHEGNPTFFVTMTCNPQWPEISSRLRPGQEFHDIPVVVARAFKVRLGILLRTLRMMFPNGGGQVYCIHVIEFQKRGLPHAHILTKLRRPCTTPEDIDAVVSAELPQDPADRALVMRFMLHSHPPANRRKYKCQTDHPDGSRTCKYKYPHPLQPRTTIDVQGRVHYRRRRPGDEWVVPHCLPLLRLFDCHINFEVANTSHIFQYLFKYIHKGPDTARFRVQVGEREPINELDDYWKGRYLSAGEAVWRIFGFHIARKRPAVTSLPVHGQESIHFQQYARRNNARASLSSLQRYFARPDGDFVDVWTGAQRPFAELLYDEYFSLFRLEPWRDNQLDRDGFYAEKQLADGSIRMLCIRRQARHVARLATVPPSRGELFYQRSLLSRRPASSFIDLRTINGITHPSYQEAARALGLFADDNEAEQAMMEAINSLRTPYQLRVLFVHLLINDCAPFPLRLWELFEENMSRDYLLRNDNHADIARTLALGHLGHLLEEYGKTLGDYDLPQPNFVAGELMHEIERWHQDPDRLRQRADDVYQDMNAEQRHVYDEVVGSILRGERMVAFVDGKAGTGKTQLVNAICDAVRSRGKIVIPTASSAFAAQLYPGGRTTHSAFKIPVNDLSELLESPIQRGTSRADLLHSMDLCIADEAPMANKAVYACMDELLKRLEGNRLPFGGKTILALGDFRQTCPVIRGGSRAQVVDASLRSSPLWQHFRIFRLTQHRRMADDPEYADWVDSIGNGAGPEVEIPFLDKVEREEDLIDFVYPPDILADPVQCLKRSILAPTNRQVDDYNARMLQRIPGADHEFYAADSLLEADDANLIPPSGTLDFVARQTPPGLPHFTLNVKKNAVYRLMRNLSIDRGLVKNMRVVVRDIGRRIITVCLLRGVAGPGQMDEEDILIPRITFTYKIPGSGFTLHRRQFPLAPAYATTFNSCQGLTLDKVGIDLTRPVFSHGQLNTAMSRIRTRHDGKVRLRPGETTTINVTYDELLLL